MKIATTLKRATLALTIAATIFAGCYSFAATTTFNDVARGAYDDTGVFGTGGSGTPNGNYLTGFFTLSNATEYRSFFTFDLTTLSGAVTSATFGVDLGPPAFGSGPSPVTVSFVAYSGDIAALDAGNAGLAGFAALGNGIFLGSFTANTSDTGALTITLNSAALAAIQAAEGGDFAIGASLFGVPPADYVFGASINTPLNPLVVTTQAVPEPGSLILLGTGLLGLAGTIRRRIF